MRGKVPIAIAGLLAACVLVAAAVLAVRPSAPVRAASTLTPAVPSADGGTVKEPDGGEGTAERLAALEEAKRDGTLGVAADVPRAPATGWAGERVMSRHFDDWEPAIATDPNAPFVYRLATRYGGPPACAKGCPDPAIILQISKDGGRTWGKFRYLCTCKGTSGMYDPEIEVADNTGVVQAAFMRGFSVWFTSSADHGKTWRKPVPVYGHVAWQDKPFLASSADGQDVYVAFNGPSFGDAFVAFSHDGGRTWKHRKVTDSSRYLYAFGGEVLSDGTVVFSESSLKYSGGGRRLHGASLQVALRSTNGGRSWSRITVDSLRLGRNCRTRGCPPDYYDGHVALGADASDRLIMVGDGALKARGIRSVWAWTSIDGGATWGPRVRLGTGAANAGFPAAVGTGGEFRVWYMSR